MKRTFLFLLLVLLAWEVRADYTPFVVEGQTWVIEYGYGLVDAYSSVINTPTIAYIQNDTITGTSIISADNIYVGRDVTDRKEYGDVILGQGDITLKAGYIKIKNSTTVPLGTKLKIENQ